MLYSLHDVACPPFDQAVAELEAHVRATWQPLGILIAGSIVRGEAGPTSDLDVFVIHDQPWRLRAQRPSNEPGYDVRSQRCERTGSRDGV